MAVTLNSQPSFNILPSINSLLLCFNAPGLCRYEDKLQAQGSLGSMCNKIYMSYLIIIIY